MVRALDFYPGGPGSNPIWDVGFFQTMHHFLITNFHIRKKDRVSVPGGQNTGKTQVINYCFFVDRNKPIILLYLGLYVIYWLKFDANGLKSREKMTTEC